MRRRRFLHGLAATALVGGAFPALSAPSRRGLLVLVELKGGNDGLNTVVPYRDADYRRLRPRLAIDESAVIRLTDDAGFHPALVPLMGAWDAGEIAVVQGIGYPSPNLSHFRSIEIWDTGSRSDEYLDDGWLTRVLAKHPSPSTHAADGVVVGLGDLGPLAGTGARVIALTEPEAFLRDARLVRATGEGGRNGALAHILRVEADIRQSAQRLKPGADPGTPFPPGAFGSVVKTVARLAANPDSASVIRITLAGFDTHANQAGIHAALLRQLAEGLAALRTALQALGRWEDTLVATYAEFGRRPAENVSGGTDHGTAAAHLVLGGAVRGGLQGRALRLDRLDAAGNPVFTVDCRSYLSAVVDAAWGIRPSEAWGPKDASIALGRRA